MGKYFKEFDTSIEYEEFVLNNLETPNISKLGNNIYYNSNIEEEDSSEENPNAEHDYSLDYLTFDIVSNGTLTWTSVGNDPPSGKINYSIDLGTTWTEINISDTEFLSVTLGLKVLFKGNNSAYSFYWDNRDYGSIHFGGTASFNISGNIMSLIGGDDFLNTTSFNYDLNHRGLEYLFGGTKVINAKNLILPATTYIYCYYGMFSNCTLLEIGPTLPAIILTPYCYSNMFYGCISLTTAPKLPATTLASHCCSNMFRGCTSLIKAPKLPATTLADYCYEYMFYGCTGLTKAPELPATTLTTYCYQYMFYNCSNLNYIKALYIASPGSKAGYWLTGVATNGTFIKNSEATWNNNTSGSVPTKWKVKIAPFEYSLQSGKYIKGFSIHSQYTSFTETNDFVLPNVSHCELEGDVHYNPYIHDYSLDYLTFVALEDGTFKFSKSGMLYSIDDGETWTSLSANTASPTITAGNEIMWKSTSLSPASGTGSGTFSSTGNYNVKGNVMSILNGDNFKTATSVSSYAFLLLFSSSSKLINAENLVIPATSLSTYCYYGMFLNCSNMVSTPKELPSTSTATYCYANMFRGCSKIIAGPKILATSTSANSHILMFYECTSLVKTPDLLPATLSNYCYSNMFKGCTSLSSITCLATNISATSCTSTWVDGVASSGTFTKASSMSSWTTGTSGIPANWTVKNMSS